MHYVLATGVQALAVVLAVPVLARVTTNVQLGQAGIYIAILATLTGVMDLGLAGWVTREFFIGGEPFQTLKFALWTTLAVTGALFLVAATWFAAVGTGGFVIVAFCGIAGGTGATLVANVQAVHRARKQSLRFLALASAAGGASQLGGCMAAAVFHTGLAYAAGAATVTCTAAALAWRTVGDSTHVSVNLRSALTRLRAAAPTVPHVLAIALIATAPRFVLAHDYGSLAVGQYQIALVCGAGVGLLVTAANNLWAPAVYAAKDPWHFIAISTAFMWELASLVTLPLLFVLPEILSFIGGAPPSQKLIVTASLLALTPFATILYLSSVHVLFRTGNTVSLTFAAPVAAAAAAISAVVLIPMFQLAGAAAAVLGGMLVLILICRLSAVRLANIPYRLTAVLGKGAVPAVILAFALVLSSTSVLLRIGIVFILLPVLAWRVVRVRRSLDVVAGHANALDDIFVTRDIAENTAVAEF
jgi:O-antigen/teichoic acid export membrane protein